MTLQDESTVDTNTLRRQLWLLTWLPSVFRKSSSSSDDSTIPGTAVRTPVALQRGESKQENPRQMFD